MVVRQAVALTKDLTSDKKDIYYRLKTNTGNYLMITEGELKHLIKSKKIEVLNLELTSDYELKDKDSEYTEFNRNVETYKNTHVRVDRSFIRELNCKKALSFKSNVNIESMKSKSKFIRYGNY